MGFYLDQKRRTVLSRFYDVEKRNDALEKLNKQFPNVKFQPVHTSDLLINKTGSMVFDLHVKDEVESLGGFFE